MLLRYSLCTSFPSSSFIFLTCSLLSSYIFVLLLSFTSLAPLLPSFILNFHQLLLLCLSPCLTSILFFLLHFTDLLTRSLPYSYLILPGTFSLPLYQPWFLPCLFFPLLTLYQPSFLSSLTSSLLYSLPL